MRIKRIFICALSLCLCIGLFTFTASATGSDDLHSFVQCDFTSPGFIPVGESKNFTVYGTSANVSNIIYILTTRDSGAVLSGYVGAAPGYNIQISQLWSSGSVTAWRVQSNTAAAFNHEFQLTVTNQHASMMQVFNVFKVFYVGPSGITSLDNSGGNIVIRDGENYDNIDHTESLPSLPLVYSVSPPYIVDDMILDISFPVSKFVGFDQVMFNAGFWDFNHDSSFEYQPTRITSCSVLLNGAPLLISSALVDVGGDTPYDDVFTGSINAYQINYGRASIIFDVPEVIPNNGTITFRFFYNGDDNGVDEGHDLTFYFHDLYGRFSFVKTEYEILNDIYDLLKESSSSGQAIEDALTSMKNTLHADLSSIQSSLNTSNSLLQSLIGYITNFRTNVQTGFANVGNWFATFGSNITNTISSWGQSIVDAIINTNNDAADEFVEDSEQQSGDIQDSMDVIDQVTKPDIQDIFTPTVPPTLPPVDPDDPSSPTEDLASKPVDPLDQDTVASVSTVFNIFFNNGIFSSIFNFVLILMLASFVLFGKK